MRYVNVRYLLIYLRYYYAVLQARSRIVATSPAASGTSRVLTSWRDTSANTLEPSRSAVCTARARSHDPTTSRCTPRDTSAPPSDHPPTPKRSPRTVSMAVAVLLWPRRNDQHGSRVFFLGVYYAPAPRVGSIKWWCGSDVCLTSVCRIHRA